MAISHRRTNLAQVLIVLGCSSAAPSTDSGPIQGVDAIEQIDCNGFCTQETIEGTATAQGIVWITRGKESESSNGQTTSSVAQLGEVVFGADAGVTILATTPPFTAQCCSGGSDVPAGVGVSSDGNDVYFAHVDHNAPAVLVQHGADGGTLTASPNDGVIMGVAAQPSQHAVFAVLDSCCNNNGKSCQVQCYNGTDSIESAYSNNFNNGGSNNATATLYNVDFADGGITPQAIHVDAEISTHLFASDGTNVYWIANGSVWSMPADFSQPPTQANSVSDIPVAIAASGGVVAWTTISGTNGSCPNVAGNCFKPSAYAISTSTNGVIYSASSSTEFALGLAIDGSNAYFSIVQQYTTTSCCNNQDGGVNFDTNIYTTNVARVSLTGGSSQTPSLIQFNQPPFADARLFGPRRFLIDANFVYGIDPAYVLRIDKTAFK